MSIILTKGSKKRQNWATPQKYVDVWKPEYGLTLDVCAEAWNAKLPRFITKDVDGLKAAWRNYQVDSEDECNVAYCNPPYSQTKKWLQKALHETAYNVKTLMLVPASTGVGWFFDAMQHCGIWLFHGRIKFQLPPEATPEEIKKNAPSFSPCLIEVGMGTSGFLGYRSAETGLVVWEPPVL